MKLLTLWQAAKIRAYKIIENMYILEKQYDSYDPPEISFVGYYCKENICLRKNGFDKSHLYLMFDKYAEAQRTIDFALEGLNRGEPMKKVIMPYTKRSVLDAIFDFCLTFNDDNFPKIIWLDPRDFESLQDEESAIRRYDSRYNLLEYVKTNKIRYVCGSKDWPKTSKIHSFIVKPLND